MEPEIEDTSYPLFDKVSTPRMIIAQFDSINGLKQLAPLRRELLTRLEGWVSSTKPKYWFTIYLTCFILLHEVSQGCEDRYRHARANSAEVGNRKRKGKKKKCLCQRNEKKKKQFKHGGKIISENKKDPKKKPI